MNIGQNIRTLRKAKGLTLNQFATLIESDVGNLSRLERGMQGFSETTLAKIAGALGVPVSLLFAEDVKASAEFVAAGREVMEGYDYRSTRIGPTAVKVDPISDSRFMQILLVKPRLSAGFAGIAPDSEYDDGGTTTVTREWVERNRFSPEKLIAIKVRGDSMETTLYDGDTVVLNTADTKPVDGAVYAVNYEGEAVVKRFSRDAGDWWLMSDNPDQRKYHRKICRGEACIIIGRVVRKESDRI